MGEFDWKDIQGINITSMFSKKTTRMNEKETLHGLNDRFAGFIEKVRHLEHQNHLLEREIEEIKKKEESPSSLQQAYGPQLGELRKLLRDVTHQKHRIEIEHQHLEQELFDLREKCGKEARIRTDAESNLAMLKNEISEAYQAKVQLGKKAQAIADEMHSLKGNHHSEVSEIIAQLNDAQGAVTAGEFGSHDLTAALRDIRAQLEDHAVSDLHRAEESFRIQVSKLTEAAETKREALKASKQEMQEYRKRLQSKSVELDCAKGTREALEKQLREVEDCHTEEIIHYQDTIKKLENKLINAKFDMSGHLREYQALLNVKMALDVEIISYRKLLEGEESRLSAISDPQCLPMPYIYRQSPVYTLPGLSQQRRALPQYKFVEEIITETTREIEMSEFEETGSEEDTSGGDEEDCVKRERGRGEEEEGECVTNNPEEEDQVGQALGGVKQGDEDGVGVILEGAAHDEQYENKVRVESSEAEAASIKANGDMYEISHGEIRAAKSPEEEEGDEEVYAQAEEVAGLKPEDARSDINMVGELLETRDILGKRAALEDKISDASTEGSRGENKANYFEHKDSVRDQESSDAIDEMDMLKVVVEPENSSKDTDQGNQGISESERKEAGSTEPVAVSQMDTAKVSIQDEGTKSNIMVEGMATDPKDLDCDTSLENAQKEDKLFTVKSPLPMENTPVAVEVKELQQEGTSSTPQTIEMCKKQGSENSGEVTESQTPGMSEEAGKKTTLDSKDQDISTSTLNGGHLRGRTSFL